MKERGAYHCETNGRKMPDMQNAPIGWLCRPYAESHNTSKAWVPLGISPKDELRRVEGGEAAGDARAHR